MLDEEEAADDEIAVDGRVGEEPAGVSGAGEEPLVVDASGEEGLDTVDLLDAARAAREVFFEACLAISLNEWGDE